MTSRGTKPGSNLYYMYLNVIKPHLSDAWERWERSMALNDNMLVVSNHLCTDWYHMSVLPPEPCQYLLPHQGQIFCGGKKRPPMTLSPVPPLSTLFRTISWQTFRTFLKYAQQQAQYLLFKAPLGSIYVFRFSLLLAFVATNAYRLGSAVVYALPTVTYTDK